MAEIPDKVFINNLNNLKELSAQTSLILERRILEIGELISSIITECKATYGEPYDIYELLAIISEEYRASDFQVHKERLEENEEMLLRHTALLNDTDRCIFCELLMKYAAENGISLSEEAFITEASSGEVFTYVKSPISDEAYEVFTENLSDARVFYSKNFKEATQMVVDGSVDFCLLPLEEKGDRIHTVNQLIFANDLKINGVTPVFGFDGMADMKYALVGRNLNLPQIEPGDDRYLEIRLPTDSQVSIGQLVCAAENFENSVYRINTETLKVESGEKNYYEIVFRDGGSGFAKLLTYLTVFTGEYIPVGIYKNLE